MLHCRLPSRLRHIPVGRPLYHFCYSTSSPLSSESSTTSTSSASPSSFTPPTPPRQSQSNHSSLQSFLEYSRRTSLPVTSTTYVGTHYEYLVALTLRRLGLSLTRVGGRSDSGIDLLGTWHLPTHAAPLRVIVQCKALKAKLGPNLIRELEGAFVGAPAGWRGEGVLGILVSKREATKGVRDAMGRSRFPLVWVGVETLGLEVKEEVDTDGELDGNWPEELYREGTGVVKQMLWNEQAKEYGLEGIDVTTRYQGNAQEKELVLMWKGEVLKGLGVGKEANVDVLKGIGEEGNGDDAPLPTPLQDFRVLR